MRVKLIIKISCDTKALSKLENFGELEKLSDILSLYSLVTEKSYISKIKGIEGVVKVEYNQEGRLQPMYV